MARASRLIDQTPRFSGAAVLATPCNDSVESIFFYNSRQPEEPWKDQFRREIVNEESPQDSASYGLISETEKDIIVEGLNFLQRFEGGGSKKRVVFSGHTACHIVADRSDPNLWCKVETKISGQPEDVLMALWGFEKNAMA